MSFEKGACTDRVNLEILKKCSDVINIVLDRGSCETPTTLGRQGTDSTKLFCIFIPNFVRYSTSFSLDVRVRIGPIDQTSTFVKDNTKPIVHI